MSAPNLVAEDYREIAQIIRERLDEDRNLAPLRARRLSTLLDVIEPEPLPSDIAALLAATKEATQQSNSARLGVWMRANSEGRLTQYLTKGWSSPSAWGCAATEPTAEISILVKTLLRSDIHAEFAVKAVAVGEPADRYVLVKVNGEELAIWRLVDGDQVTIQTIDIPARGFAFGTHAALLNFSFELVNPMGASQGVVHTLNSWRLGLIALRLSPIVTPGAAAAEMGVPLYACRGGSLLRYMDSGWYAPENWGRWSIGTEASLSIPLETPAARLTLDFVVWVYIGHLPTKKEVTVVINEKVRVDWSFSSNNLEIQRIDAQFDSEVSSLHIKFIVANPESPYMSGDLKDRRRLGMALQAMMITEPAKSL